MMSLYPVEILTEVTTFNAVPYEDDDIA